MKIFRYRQHIDALQKGDLLPPIMVDIDVVAGVCNLDCEWCCQARSRTESHTRFMPATTMAFMGEFCAEWGVKAWRIGGDSEPLLNKDINVLLDGGYAGGIEMGLITNGVYLERIARPERLKFVGVSLDAAHAATWAALKRTSPSGFRKILRNVRRLRERCPDLDISLKFVTFTDRSLSKEDFLADRSPPLPPSSAASSSFVGNSGEIDDFRRLAERLGCRTIIRDCYTRDFRANYRFSRCWVTPLSGVFDAHHRFHLCCDARGKYVLADDYTRDNWTELKRLWGSPKHRRMLCEIDPQGCLGCAKHEQNAALEAYFSPVRDNFI